jgi:hypothetical protein
MENKPDIATVVWTHLVLGLVITAEAAFLFFGMRFVMPACKRIVTYAATDADTTYAIIPGSNLFLGLLHMPVYNPVSWLLAFAIIWGLFEWRLRNRSKQQLRLAVMSSLAFLLFSVVAMFTVIMVIPTAKAADRLNARHPEPVVTARMVKLDRLVGEIEQALKANDLAKADDLSHTAMGAANDLALTGDAAPVLLTSTEPMKVEALRSDLDAMATSMRAAWFAARTRNTKRIQPTMQEFREAYAQVKKDTAGPSK